MNLHKTTYFIFFCLLPVITYSQDNSEVIAQLNRDIKSNRKTITDVLTDSTWMHLHPLTSFREMIRENASSQEINIVTNTEPGIRIVINGTVIDQSGRPLPGILVYFYQTSHKGWYSDTSVHIYTYEGDHRHSRLFGYIKTGADGKFTIKTIRPNGYPQSGFAGHIHIQMWQQNGAVLFGIPGELQFDDDERMTAQRRQQSIADGFMISKNDGTSANPIYNYLIKVRSE